MSDHRRDQYLRSRINLRRGADGQLRPAGQDDDIGDVWAEQRRIRLKEAIEEDKRRAEKKQEGKWAFLRKRVKKATATPKPTVQPSSKEVVVTINVPKVRLPKLPKDKAVRFVKSLSKKQQIVGGAVVLFVLVSTIGFFMYGNEPKDKKDDKKVAATTTSIASKNQKPRYNTLLPEGKTIDELGGWARVSPPDKEPVFAFADTISGVPVIVSQQPLPASFKQDVAGEVQKLAGQFGAADKITAEDLTAFVGTSIKGPQSVILAKDNLLILIKSDTKIDNQSWTDYISSLH